MKRPWHPSRGGSPTVDDLLRAQCAAHEVLAEDAAGRAGLGDVKPVRHLHVVYNWADEIDQDAE